MMFDEITTKLASSELKTDIVREMQKSADLRTSLVRALGGAAIGGAAGGGLGALLAHVQGGDVVGNARRGAIGGAGLGALGGGMSGYAPKGSFGGIPLQAANNAATAGIGGLTAAFGAQLASPVGGKGGVAAEQMQREVGRFEAQQAIKQQQQSSLAPQHVEAFHHAKQDEVIMQADPRLVQSSFETMKRFAPNLAADPNAVRSFLRESATWGAGPSYATLKNLADAERAVSSAGGAGSPY